MKIVHIDDEPLARNIFKLILTENHPELKLVGQAKNALEGLKIIKKTNPDVVFLDVNMPGGSGFDMLESLSNVDFKIVFLTAHNEYAIKAIKKGAFDYLLKPIDQEELRLVFDKYSKLKKENKPLDGKIYVHHLDRIEIISIDEIIYLKSDSNYTNIVLDSGDTILSSKSLSHYSKLLPEENFYRVHQSYIVKLSKVIQIVKEDNGMLIMTNNYMVPISRRNKAEVNHLFKN